MPPLGRQASGPEYILDRAGCPRQRRTALAAKANDPRSRTSPVSCSPLAWARSVSSRSSCSSAADRPPPECHARTRTMALGWCFGGRGEYPADVLPMRSGRLPLSRLVRLPLPERPGSHLRQLQRAPGPRRLRVSSGRIRAQHRDRGRIARPGPHPAPSRSPGCPRDARQPSGSQRCTRASARPAGVILQPGRAAPVPVLPGGRCTARPHGQRMLPRPWDAFPTPGRMHRWFRAVVTGPPISVSKRPSSCKILVGAAGFEPAPPRL